MTTEEKAVEKVMSKTGGGSDEEGGRTRKFVGTGGVVLRIYLIVFSAYVLLYLGGAFDLVGFYLYPASHDALCLGIILSLVFILFPATRKSPKDQIPWYDWMLVIAALTPNIYMTINFLDIASSVRAPNTLEIIFGAILIPILLEAVRRSVHWILSLIGFLFILYPFISEYLPGFLSSRGFGFRIVVGTFMISTAHGLFNSTWHMVTTIIISFLIFGAFLIATGAGRAFIDIALSLVGRFRGGAAKAAVFASALFGMVSGSSMANVATTGTITIPLMKSIGYKPEFAGAVEAVASNGGPIMPPVMGSIIFVMMDIIGATYVEVMIAAAIPAILYYSSILFMVDLEAAKTGLKGLPKERIPPLKPTLRRSWWYVLPFIVLLYLIIIKDFQVEKAVIFSIVTLVVLSFLGPKQNWATPKTILKGLEDAPKGIPMVASAVCVAALLLTPIYVTGIGLSLMGALVDIAGGNTLVLLIMASIMAFVLGLPLPALATYILLAILVAPALVATGMPMIGVHLFLVYWGVTALITPPVGGAFMVAGTIARADIMKTGWQACRLGIATYLVPFMFIYSNELLLIGSPFSIFLRVVVSIIGLFYLSIGSEGYFVKNLHWLTRIVIFSAGLTTIAPFWIVNVIGIGVGALILIGQVIQNRRISVNAIAYH